MKKAFSLMLVLATLFLCACDNSLLPDEDDPVLEEMADYITEADILISGANVEYIDTKSKKVYIEVYLSNRSAPYQYAEVAENAIEYVKTAVKKKNKKLDTLDIRYKSDYEGGHIFWKTKDYKSGELDSAWPEQLPNGTCTLKQIQSIFREENKENLGKPIPTTTTAPQTTLSVDEQKKQDDIEYIEQQLLDVATDIKCEAFIYFPPESPEQIKIVLHAPTSKENDQAKEFLPIYIPILKDALKYTERTLYSLEFCIWPRYSRKSSDVEQMIWNSSDFENGRLCIKLNEFNFPFAPIIEQICSLEELFAFDIEEFTTAIDEQNNSHTP